MPFHDGNRRGKTEARTLANFFRGEKRLENFLLNLRRNAGARVPHTQDQMRSRGWRSLERFHAAVAHEIFRLDGQHTAVRHRVAGVHAKVEQDLMELRRVAADGPYFRRHDATHLDVFWKGVARDFEDFLDDKRRLNEDALSLGTSRETENLPDKIRAALRTELHRFEDLIGVGIVELGAQQLDRDEDRREDVVEVVRDAAGERAEAFQALRTEELRLEFLPLCHIRVDHQDRLRCIEWIAQQRPATLRDDFAPGMGRVPQISRPIAALQNGAIRFRELLGVGLQEPLHRVRHRVVTFPAKDSFRAFAPK